jgi:hypothetical protein
LGQGAEVDLLPVHEVMRLGQRGQAVVDGVGGGQAAALEAQPRQQGVGLDHLLQGRVVEKEWDLTIKGNSVAVLTDGTAELGLGPIGRRRPCR